MWSQQCTAYLDHTHTHTHSIRAPNLISNHGRRLCVIYNGSCARATAIRHGGWWQSLDNGFSLYNGFMGTPYPTFQRRICYFEIHFEARQFKIKFSMRTLQKSRNRKTEHLEQQHAASTTIPANIQRNPTCFKKKLLEMYKQSPRFAQSWKVFKVNSSVSKWYPRRKTTGNILKQLKQLAPGYEEVIVL